MATIERYSLASGATRYQVRYRTPDRLQTKKRGFSTKRDAQAFAASVEVAKVRGEYVAPAAGLTTVTELYQAWSATRTRVKATTHAKAESAWSAHVEKRWASTPVGDISPAAVRRWTADLTAAGAGAATVENALGLLRAVLEQAVEDRRIVRNPSDGVKAPRRRHRPRGYLTHDQVDRLAVEMTRARGTADDSPLGVHPSYGTVTLLLAYTGLRWGEMAALTPGDIDLVRRRILVTKAYAEVRGQLVLDSAKNHERRSVPFPAFLVEPLSEMTLGKLRSDPVFTGPKDAVLRVNNFRPRYFAAAVRRCQSSDFSFPTVTPHDLRHTAASLAISVGANVKSVQTMLGHKSAAMTLDVYADLFPDDLDAVAVALDHAHSSASVPKMCPRAAEEPAP